MILIIAINQIPFHHLEFVKPIENILKKINMKFTTIHYKDLNSEMLSKADKIIISGTSLKDNSFLDDVNEFVWLKDFKKPVLGICGGMHILCLVYNGELKKSQEIGLNTIEFNKDLFGMAGKTEVYELHDFYATSDEFDVIARSGKCHQVIKHKTKPFYATLFHPEVRNKKLIERFAKM